MPTGIYKHQSLTETTKDKIRKANKGKHNGNIWLNKKHPRGMLGKTAWNKGIKSSIIPVNAFVKGHIISEETKIKMRKNSYMKRNTGKDSPNWKGGCQKNERNDPAYHLWKKKIFKKFPQCILKSDECFGYRIVHHIYSWSDYPKLRYSVLNGITLCQAHHPRGKAKEELFRKKFSYLVKQKQ